MAAPTSPPSLGFFHGLRTVPRALDVLKAVPRILHLLLIPLFLTVLLDGLVLYYGFGWLHAQIVFALPKGGLGVALLSVVAAVLLILALAWAFGFVYLTLCELVVDSVSEAVEQHLTGHPGSVGGLSHRARGVLLSIVQAIVLTSLGLLGALLNLLPLIGQVASISLAAVLLGYGFFSVSASRKVQSLSARISLARAHLGAIMGLGGAAFFVNLIPVLNLLSLPVFVVAGTILFLDVTPPATSATGGGPAPAWPELPPTEK